MEAFTNLTRTHGIDFTGLTIAANGLSLAGQGLNGSEHVKITVDDITANLFDADGALDVDGLEEKFGTLHSPDILTALQDVMPSYTVLAQRASAAPGVNARREPSQDSSFSTVSDPSDDTSFQSASRHDGLGTSEDVIPIGDADSSGNVASSAASSGCVPCTSNLWSNSDREKKVFFGISMLAFLGTFIGLNALAFGENADVNEFFKNLGCEDGGRSPFNYPLACREGSGNDGYWLRLRYSCPTEIPGLDHFAGGSTAYRACHNYYYLHSAAYNNLYSFEYGGGYGESVVPKVALNMAISVAASALVWFGRRGPLYALHRCGLHL